ncbi:MAG: MFS transporter [Acidimicrobiaceae bacterium]|nr:MFS transporter [Acidimicrobiaceae bacterium]MXW75886.1 MFS transporter [Acidimicrobiaceae bacterium]MYC43005.1 MFS transporter [Acidimicrobiaceae bacterium]MYD07299.1 MFS transporter [Acidimicrobiaceae bacterium]MYI58020.1 MFS transporter [Acidimicrobiaceae bacterium]
MRRTADPAWLFLATTAVLAAGTNAKWIVFMPRLVDDLQLEPYQLALLGTALELSGIIGEIPTGAVADLISRRLSIIASFVIMGPILALAGVFESFWLIALTQVGWGLAWTLHSGADVAWLTDELRSPDRVDRLLISRAKVQLAANALGVPIALALVATTTRTTAIVVAGASISAWGLVLAMTMPETGFERTARAAGAEFKRIVGVGTRLTARTRPLRLLAISSLFYGLGSGVVDHLDLARLVEVGIPSDVDEVFLYGALALVQAAAGIVLIRLIERRLIDVPAARVLSLLMLLAGVAIAVTAGANVGWAIFVGLVMQEALRMTAEPFITMIANSHSESDVRATMLSFMSQAYAGGEILSGVFLGVVASVAGIGTAFAIGAVIVVGSSLISSRI